MASGIDESTLQTCVTMEKLRMLFIHRDHRQILCRSKRFLKKGNIRYVKEH